MNPLENNFCVFGSNGGGNSNYSEIDFLSYGDSSLAGSALLGGGGVSQQYGNGLGKNNDSDFFVSLYENPSNSNLNDPQSCNKLPMNYGPSSRLPSSMNFNPHPYSPTSGFQSFNNEMCPCMNQCYNNRSFYSCSNNYPTKYPNGRFPRMSNNCGGYQNDPSFYYAMNDYSTPHCYQNYETNDLLNDGFYAMPNGLDKDVLNPEMNNVHMNMGMNNVNMHMYPTANSPQSSSEEEDDDFFNDKRGGKKSSSNKKRKHRYHTRNEDLGEDEDSSIEIKKSIKKRVPKSNWTKMTKEIFDQMVEYEKGHSNIKQCELEKIFNVNRSTYWRWKKQYNLIK